MPCYRCGTRQVDPDRGSSPWLRGVRADHQVLICPDCQTDGAWVTDLDRCALCASVHLVRRLGEVECRDCGAAGAEAVGSVAASAAGSVAVDLTVEDTPAAVGAGPADAVPAGLAEEVEQALARVLRWPTPTSRGAGIS
ncbi:MAG TPA: hypothetical protein VN695_08380 [Streptosporangiaceae bacterium]|nr:hypothetical protein [Streptosporangiaceae bacterium]